MTAILIALVIFLGALVLWFALQSAQGNKKNESLEGQLSELRRDLQTIATAQAQSAGQVKAIGDAVTLRLENVTTALHDGIKSSAQITGQLTSQAQNAMAEELKNTREQIGQMQKQLGAVELAGQQMSQATNTLEGILGGAKSRGSFGEVTLERLLEDCLAPAQFRTQHRFSNGEAADAVILLRDEKIMAIDSKFPLDAFRRIGTDGDDARKAFASAVKIHADSIAKKYIVPQESTLDFALMFVPSESVYYELLMTQDSKGQQLDSYCRDKKIFAVSPNTLYAHLCVIAMGMRGMQIEENAKRLSSHLAGMDKQLRTFTDVYERLGTHLKNAQQSYSDGEKRLEKAQNTLDGMLSGGLGGPDIQLEPETLPKSQTTQGSLALPIDTSAKKSA